MFHAYKVSNWGLITISISGHPPDTASVNQGFKVFKVNNGHGVIKLELG